MKSLTTVGAREKDEGAKLYNDAVVKNDAVVEQLKAQLLTAGVKQLAVNEEMSKDAIASLSRFREFVEATAKLSNVRPLDPDSILKEIGQTRDGGLIVAGVVLGAVRAAEWWYAENGRARDALRAQLDTFRMPPWHELHAPGDPPK